MSPIRLAMVTIAALGTVALPVQAAAIPTHLRLTLPPAVEIGGEIMVEAALTTADGVPVAGAMLTLFQVGAVGQRLMARTPTDERGLASFLFSEFTVPHLDLRVVFPGDGAHGSSVVDAAVDVSGIDLPPSVLMAHNPGPLTKSVLFSILAAVWLTYGFAASCVVRVTRVAR